MKLDPFRLGTPVQMGISSALLSRQAGTVVGLWRPHQPFSISDQGLIATCTSDGFRLVNPHYLKRAAGSPPAHLARWASSIEDVVDQGFTLRAEPGELIHRATRDLWGFEPDNQGRIVLCRLFDPSGHPLRV